MPSEETFIRNLRRRREELGLTQQELGRRTAAFGYEMPKQTVHKIESGTRPVRLGEAVALALALGATVEGLMYDHSEPVGISAHKRAEAEKHRDAVRAALEEAEARVRQIASDYAAAEAYLRMLDQQYVDQQLWIGRGERSATT